MSKFQVGDRVRVRKPADVDQPPCWVEDMDKFDGTEQEISAVRDTDCIVRLARDTNAWAFHFDWLEPVKPKTLDLGEPVERMRSWVPEGYIVIEMAVPKAMAAAIGEGNALIWKRPLKGENFFYPANGRESAIGDYAHYYYPVIVPTTPPAEQYRDPTQADVGKMVEVRDREKEPWQARELLALIGDETIVRRFVCRDLPGGVNCHHWTFARIKIEESK